jgi:hypothetical protein
LGFSLIEVVIALGIAAALSLLVARIMISSSAEQARLRSLDGMAALATYLDNIMRSPRDLRATILANPGLADCVGVTAGAIPRPCGKDPQNLEFTITVGTGTQTVTYAREKTYMRGLNPCDRNMTAPDAVCPIAAGVKFKPLCDGGGATCTNADTYEFVATVEVPKDPRTGANLLIAGPPVKDRIVKVTIPRATLRASFECEQGQSMMGFDSTGFPVCVNNLNDFSCPGGCFLNGFDAKGKAICFRLNVSTDPPRVEPCPSPQ